MRLLRKKGLLSKIGMLRGNQNAECCSVILLLGRAVGRFPSERLQIISLMRGQVLRTWQPRPANKWNNRLAGRASLSYIKHQSHSTVLRRQV